MSPTEVWVAGSIAFDHIFRVTNRGSESDVAFAPRRTAGFGGVGGNVAVRLSALGLRSGVIAVVGREFSKARYAPVSYREYMKENGVDLSLLVENDTPTPAFFSFEWDGGREQFYYEELQGYRESLAARLDEITPKVMRGSALHLSTGPYGLYGELAGRLRGAGWKGLITFDPGQELFRRMEEFPLVLPHLDALFLNEHELEHASGVIDVEEPSVPLVVSYGKEGAELRERGKKPLWVKPAPVDEVRGELGAGDAHRAGFIAALLKGFDRLTALRAAAISASFAVETEEPQTRLPDWEGLERKYVEVYGERPALSPGRVK